MSSPPPEKKRRLQQQSDEPKQCQSAHCPFYGTPTEAFCSEHRFSKEVGRYRADAALHGRWAGMIEAIVDIHPKRLGHTLAAFLHDEQAVLQYLKTTYQVPLDGYAHRNEPVMPPHKPLVVFLNQFFEMILHPEQRVMTLPEFEIMTGAFENKSQDLFPNGLPIRLHQHLMTHCVLQVIEPGDWNPPKEIIYTPIYDKTDGCAVMAFYEAREKRRGLSKQGAVMNEIEQTLKGLLVVVGVFDLVMEYACRHVPY